MLRRGVTGIRTDPLLVWCQGGPSAMQSLRPAYDHRWSSLQGPVASRIKELTSLAPPTLSRIPAAVVFNIR